MTGTAPRLTAFAVGLALLFGAAMVAGGLIDPAPPRSGDARAAAPHTQAGAMTGMAPAEKTGGAHTAMSKDVRGLSVAADGLRLVLDTPAFERDQTNDLRFRIVDEHGAAVRYYDVEHTKRMHLIVVRRDLTGFQHLHPRQSADGTWHTPLRLDAAGSYRVFADFSHDETAETLATDLTVDGAFAAHPLAAPAATAEADGYQVRLRAPRAAAGQEAPLRFEVTRDGRPAGVQPYLGADGHLVALRQGDLAFLHVHPTDSAGTHTITFDATFPTAGSYRLFLQFRAGNTVHTVAFTQEVR